MSQQPVQPYQRPYGRNFGATQNFGQRARLVAGSILPAGVPLSGQRIRTYRPGGAVQPPAPAAGGRKKAGGGCGG